MRESGIKSGAFINPNQVTMAGTLLLLVTSLLHNQVTSKISSSLLPIYLRILVNVLSIFKLVYYENWTRLLGHTVMIL